MLAAYGNHPSFLMMAYGNEPAGRIDEYLGTMGETTGASAIHAASTPAARAGLCWRRTTITTSPNRASIAGAKASKRGSTHDRPKRAVTTPTMWIACRSPSSATRSVNGASIPISTEIEKYTGLLKPKNFEIFRDFLEANHMGDQAQDFLMASGKLQALCYKEEIESALRTPGFAGFQLLDLHDFPGQGTALIGVLDPSGMRKVTSQRRSSSASARRWSPWPCWTVAIWTTDEIFTADVRIANFGAVPLVNAHLDWRLVSEDGSVVDEGEVKLGDVAVGNDNTFGPIHASLGTAPAARKLTLAIGVDADNVQRAENDWDLWVFAPELETPDPDDLLIVTKLDATARARLKAGGKVLLLPDPHTVHAPSQIGFSPAFWNTAWTSGQTPHTLGILCDPGHPVFADFPTEAHSNWQWWELIHGSAAMVLDGFPPALRPLVQPIDTWFEARRLSLLFEARIGQGSLMVCTMNLAGDLSRRPVARQMWACLLAYLASEKFVPEVEVDLQKIGGLFVDGRRRMVNDEFSMLNCQWS